MSENQARALARLERQFLAADNLTLVLAIVAADHQRDSIRWEALKTSDRMTASYAMSSAMRLTSTWVNVYAGELNTKLGRYPVADAVAAEDLAEALPELASNLGAAWQLTLKVRAKLHALGPDAEAVALRIAPSWRADLRDLATAVAAVIGEPS